MTKLPVRAILKLETDRRSVGTERGEKMTLKERIIEAAYELFGEKGYDKTTIAQIIKKAGASKGGFYHHFQSKEEILETITFAYIERVRKAYRDVLEDDSMTVIEKFVASYHRINEMKLESVQEWGKIKNLYASGENHVLLIRMGQAFEGETALYYGELIEMGIREGVFQTAFPQQLAALWAREAIKFQRMTRHLLLDPNLEEENFIKTLQFNELLINQQLGLGAKTIELESMGRNYLHAMRKQLKGRDFNVDLV